MKATTLLRLEELDLFADWLTDNDPAEFLTYVHQRTAALEAGDAG